MKNDFILPDIGEGIVECEVVKWLVATGEEVKEDQPVVELMTDKAVVQIPADRGGVVSQLYYQEGEIAQVHKPLFSLTPNTVQTDLATAETKAMESASEQATAVCVTPEEIGNGAATTLSSTELRSVTGTGAAILQRGDNTGGASASSGKALASPAVRRICREYDLDITTIQGSGKDGRVLKEDVLAFQEQSRSASFAVVADLAPETVTDATIRVEKLRGIKAAMARQMALSSATIPAFTYGDEIDAGRLMRLRKELQPRAEQQGVRLTLMAFFMKAIATAVQTYPLLNSRMSEDCSEIHYLPDCNIGMAVDSKVGLLVPNVKRVNYLSLMEIASEVQRLTDCAREGRVSQEDLQGGTISISNVGALGGTYMVPMINPPEVAIVALGKIQPLPRFDEVGQIQRSNILTLCWSGDHRVIDGGTMARFSTLWQSYLEQPATLLLDLR